MYQDQQSAWKDYKERESFNKVKSLIKNKQANHLIVWDLDRIYRNRRKLIEFFEYCKLYGCKIHSARQEWLEQLNDMPSPWDEAIHDLMLHIMGWMAEDESNKKSARIKAATRKKGDITISYKGNKWGRKKISTQKINKILSAYSEGKSIRDISRELNLSHGVVHKYIIINKEKELSNN